MSPKANRYPGSGDRKSKNQRHPDSTSIDPETLRRLTQRQFAPDYTAEINTAQRRFAEKAVESSHRRGVLGEKAIQRLSGMSNEEAKTREANRKMLQRLVVDVTASNVEVCQALLPDRSGGLRERFQRGERMVSGDSAAIRLGNEVFSTAWSIGYDAVGGTYNRPAWAAAKIINNDEAVVLQSGAKFDGQGERLTGLILTNGNETGYRGVHIDDPQVREAMNQPSPDLGGSSDSMTLASLSERVMPEAVISFDLRPGSTGISFTSTSGRDTMNCSYVFDSLSNKFNLVGQKDMTTVPSRLAGTTEFQRPAELSVDDFCAVLGSAMQTLPR